MEMELEVDYKVAQKSYFSPHFSPTQLRQKLRKYIRSNPTFYKNEIFVGYSPFNSLEWRMNLQENEKHDFQTCEDGLKRCPNTHVKSETSKVCETLKPCGGCINTDAKYDFHPCLECGELIHWVRSASLRTCFSKYNKNIYRKIA